MPGGQEVCINILCEGQRFWNSNGQVIDLELLESIFLNSDKLAVKIQMADKRTVYNFDIFHVWQEVTTLMQFGKIEQGR